MYFKKIKRLNFFKEQSINNLLRIVLSSFLMISFFYITPILLMFSEKNFNNKEFTNNSKKILAYTLNNGSRNQDENINENDVLFDIFSLNELETDSVRLSASTIKNSFLFFTFSIILISWGNKVKATGLTNFFSLTSFKL